MRSSLRPISSEDIDRLVALNNDFATELSPTDNVTFPALVAEAYYAKCTADLTAFLIAFTHKASYNGINFLWFKNTTDRFVYIDRIAVAATAQGAGLAGRLYEDLFALAAAGGFDRICCEVNIKPANPASDRFHQSRGFVGVGRANLTDRGKTVRYLQKSLKSE